MISKLQFLSLALLGFAAAPAPAQTAPAAVQEAPIVITRRLAPSPDLVVRTVSIADLNLTSAEGQQEMEKRVSHAVDSICTIPSPLPSYKGRMEKPCRDEAWESARWQMKAAVLRASNGS